MDKSKIEDVIGNKFLRKNSKLSEKDRESLYMVEECGLEEFTGAKYVLLFFSAEWCPPCNQFVQVLKDFYNEVNLE